MTRIQRWADRHRLKTRPCHGDHTTVIPGRWGHIFQYSDNLLGLLVMPDPPRPRYWGHTRPILVGLGMTILQDGDGEGSSTFDPQNRAQARLAIEKAGIRYRKKVSPEAKAKLLKASQTTRFKRMDTVLGGHLEPQERPRVSGQGSGRR